MLTRRSLFGLLPFAALPAAPAVDPGRAAVTTLDPEDPLARLAHHFASLADRLPREDVRAVVAYEESAEGDRVATEAVAASPRIAHLYRAEEALEAAMTERGLAAFVSGGRVFINTGFPTTYNADLPRWVFAYDLFEPIDPDPPTPFWLLTPANVNGWHYDGRRLQLTVDVAGAEAEAVLAWLDASCDDHD